MIVCHEQQTVFVHVPKCAGTSVRTALKDAHDDYTVFYGVRSMSGAWGGSKKDLCHLTAPELRQATRRDTKDYLHVVVTRDPVSRWLSAYSEHQRHCKEFFPGHAVPPPMTLLRQVILWRETGDERLSDDTEYVHMRPMKDYTTATNTVLVPMEALAAPGLMVRSKIGRPFLVGPISKTNEFSREKRRFSYGDELQRMKNGDLADEARRLINKAYAEDVAIHKKSVEAYMLDATVPIVWINLEKHGARKQHMMSVLAGTTNKRVRALAPKDIAIVENRPDRHAKETACLCSHLEAMGVMCESFRDREWVVIAEDDVAFPFGPLLSPSALSSTSPGDAEVLQLCTVNPGFYSSPQKALWTRWLPSHYGTQAYAIRPSAAERILRSMGVPPEGGTLTRHLAGGRAPNLLGCPGATVADDCLYRMCATYTCAVPVATGVEAFGSDIHPDHMPLHGEAWKAARRLAESGSAKRQAETLCCVICSP